MPFKRQREEDVVEDVIRTLNYSEEVVSGGNSVLDLEKIKHRSDFGFTPSTPIGDFSRNFFYDGQPIMFEELEGGAYGRVLSGVAKNGPRFTIKLQDYDLKKQRSLEVAQALQKCNLVSFKSFRNRIEMTLNGKRAGVKMVLATFMEHLDGDCSQLGFGSRSENNPLYRRGFVTFMDNLRSCLEENGASFCDMKPGNVGYKKFEQRGRPDQFQFTLIDLDGINDDIATYPLIARFANNYEGPQKSEDMKAQTEYAFEITKLIVCLKGVAPGDPETRVASRFYYESKLFGRRASDLDYIIRMQFNEEATAAATRAKSLLERYVLG